MRIYLAIVMCLCAVPTLAQIVEPEISPQQAYDMVVGIGSGYPEDIKSLLMEFSSTPQKHWSGFTPDDPEFGKIIENDPIYGKLDLMEMPESGASLIGLGRSIFCVRVGPATLARYKSVTDIEVFDRTTNEVMQRFSRQVPQNATAMMTCMITVTLKNGLTYDGSTEAWFDIVSESFPDAQITRGALSEFNAISDIAINGAVISQFGGVVGEASFGNSLTVAITSYLPAPNT